jgi:hypothetical protein
MASPKGKGKSRRKATAHERAVLKAAKARGLTTVDLRKPLSRYALGLVKKFEPVYQGEAAVVTIPKGKRKALGNKVDVRRGKAIVPKKSLTETIRFDAKSGRIVATDKGKRRFVGGRVRYRVKFRTQGGQKRERTFSGPKAEQSMAFFLNLYDDSDIEYDVDEEYY